MSKRVLLSASRFFPYTFGGGEVYIASVAAELKRRKWNVKIVTLGNPQESKTPYSIERYEHNGTPVSALCFHKDTLTELEKYSGISHHHRAFLRAEIGQFSPDIIHVNGLSLPSLTIAKETNIPAVMTVHHSGVVCPAGDLVRPDNSLCAFAESPEVCIPCTSLLREPKWYTGGIFGRIPRMIYSAIGKRTENTRDLPFALRVVRYPWLVEQEISYTKKMWDLAAAVIVPSQAIKNLLLRNSIDERKIVVLPHGVSVAKTGKRATKKRGKILKIGYVGQIAHHKGLHLIFEALQSISRSNEYEFHIFGNARTTEEQRYFSAIKERFSSVSFRHHGFVPHEKIQTAYEQVDIVVVPSLAYEAFCLVVHEAFACSTPVIVARSGAMPELVDHGKNGLIVERNDPRSLSDAIRSLLDDPSQLNDMRSNIAPVKTFAEYTVELERIFEGEMK